MSVNLDYLDPSLQPLVEKVSAYLAAEEALRRADVAAASGELPAAGSDQQNIQSQLATLRQEVLHLLPTRDEWVKVNLGYGPARVGAFRDETAAGPEPQYLLRVVQ